ncbi:RICIN domain-containing protein [Kitasatospora purpeofusca]|uniref:RICIN domain-containing protein n=1 Tax=Kitasatospora purpeofusca TaxID=67352 RepID=UPI002A5AC08F|nr:RICIN domain-containing protein [Kitasatospora purpeofusca]MDY0812646.1 RICIN domain-containing protein [Kitasatospora purpeofusca]
MSAPPRRALATVLAPALLALSAGFAPAAVAAPTPSATYTVSVGKPVGYAHPTDTPAVPYIDKDGTFYFQQSAALYGATDPRYWDFFTGTDFDTAVRSGAISDAVDPANANDRNNDTTWRCDNSPTGLESTHAPAGSGYAQRNYCDLSGVWVDPDTGHWYGLVHNEFTPQPFGDGLHYDAVDYAVSTDQGRTWAVKDHVITSPYSTKRGDTAAFPNQTYHYGDGDQRLFVDTASGYFYAFYGSRIVDKGGSWKAFHEHVARAPISAKMAPDSWQKWYDGAWSQPGAGGQESNLVPVSAANPTGHTPAAGEYSPANTGTVDQQVAAGTMPPTSPLFVMDITYNAYLGLYIGEPQAVDQSGSAPQQYYATDNLATQKWYPIGDTGGYHTASWYRWFLDGANRTNATIVGKTFRAYCSISCSGGAGGEYVEVTIGSSAPAAPPVDLGKTYRIGNADGRVLAQAPGGSATTSAATATGSALESWSFASNGDGSYRIANAATGQLLGVNSTAVTGRAWGARPTATAAGPNGPTVGQQWFVVRATSATGADTGTFKLLNRYSGLALGLSSADGRLAETTPARSWTNTTGDAVGGTRTAAEQALTLTATGTAGNPPLDGTHTLTASGKALDNPAHSTTQGTQLVTWTPNSGPNQTWVFTQQTDGSYQITNRESKLCMDVSDGSTSAGAKVIQWACTGGSNQRWLVTPVSGGYRIASQRSGLFLTAASAADGAKVTQQPGTGSVLQRWAIG